MSSARVLLFTMLLAGCASSLSQPIAGDANGGVITWLGINAPMAQQRADTHCREYGKTARLVSIDSNPGGRVVFECK